MTKLTLKQQLPELNPSQWRLLYRVLCEALPEENIDEFGNRETQMWTEGYNSVLTEVKATLKEVLLGETT